MTRKADEAIAALLACPTMAKAAKQTGVGEVTLWRWLQDPDFQTRYREARQNAMRHAIGALQRATAAAVATLERNLTCGLPTVEVQAARAIIEQAVKTTELDDIIARLDALERARGV